MRKIFLRFAILVFCLFLSSCVGYKTPVIKSVEDVQKLNPSTKWIRGRGLSDEAILYLGRIKGAESIDLCGGYLAGPANITDKGFENLALVSVDLPNLRGISICSSDLITDKSLYWISKTQNIEGVGITDCQKITSEGFKYLSENKNIRFLSARYLKNIDNHALKYFKEMPNLENLSVEGSDFISDESMSLISEMNLKILHCSFENPKSCSNEGFRDLGKSKTLEELHIGINGNITFEGINYLSNIKTLKVLAIHNLRHASETDFKEFHAKLPNCEVVCVDANWNSLYHYYPTPLK